MQSPVVRRTFGVVPAVVGLGVSILAVIILFWLNGWFGFSDFNAICFWTISYALILWALTTLFRRATYRLPFVIALPLAFVLGVVAGMGFTLLLFGFLGPLFFAFSVPVDFCWTLGGIAAFFAAAAEGRKWGWRIAIPTYVLSIAAALWFLYTVPPPTAITPPTLPDMVILIKDDATNEEVNSVWNSIQIETERGVTYPDGFQGASATGYQDHQAIRIQFSVDATEDTQEWFRTHAESNPYVVEIVEIPVDNSFDPYYQDTFGEVP